MNKQSFKPAKIYNLKDSICVAESGTVSKQFIKNRGGNITLFAFDEGQGLSEHTTPFDAIVYVLEGVAEITIDGNKHKVKEGEIIHMPAHVPHALRAPKAFKMCLIMIKD